MRPTRSASRASVGRSPRAWPDWCRRVEALGLDEISVADHLTPGALPPLPALAAAAAVTERVRALDDGAEQRAAASGRAGQRGRRGPSELSGGRFTLGIGRGPRRGRARRHRPAPARRRRADRPPRASGRRAAPAARRRHGHHDRVAPAPHGPSRRAGADPPGADPRGRRQPRRPGSSRRAMPTSLGLTGLLGSRRVGDHRLTHFSAGASTERLDWVRALPRETGRAAPAPGARAAASRSPTTGEAAGRGARSTSLGDDATSPSTRPSSRRSCCSVRSARSPSSCDERHRAVRHRDLDGVRRAPDRRAARRPRPHRASRRCDRVTGLLGRHVAACRRRGWLGRGPGLAELDVDAVLLSVGPDLPVPHRLRGDAARAAHHARAPRRRRRHARGARGSRRRASWSGPTCSRSARGTRPTTRWRSSPSSSAR